MALMDVTKAPPSGGITGLGVDTATNAAAASRSDAAAGAATGSGVSAALSALADRVDIQPLDVAAALQILIAEVRAELALPLTPGESAAGGTAPGVAVSAAGGEAAAGGTVPLRAPVIAVSVEPDAWEPLLMPTGARIALPSALTLLSSPAHASPVLMRMFLEAVPEEAANPAAWSAIVNQLEGTLQSALDRAVATVELWRDVPQAVVDAARETRGLVVTQLGEDPLGPLWLRPEWMWLSPQMERFRRRRRLVRRALSDPDSWPRRENDVRSHEPTERQEDP